MITTNISELAFNVTQMAGALSLVVVEEHETVIEQIQLFDPEITYATITDGQNPLFETLLRARHPSLLIDMTTIEQPKSFLDVLVQLRDKLDDEHRLILVGNSAIETMIQNEFNQLKGYVYEVFTLMPQEDERAKIIQSFEKKYGMNSDTFLEQWQAGALEDTEEFNRWYVLL
jgi:hypothetical protein